MGNMIQQHIGGATDPKNVCIQMDPGNVRTRDKVKEMIIFIFQRSLNGLSPDAKQWGGIIFLGEF